MSRISIIGAGYVGLVSGVGLAWAGHTVSCVDLDAARVGAINAGDPPFFEQGLDELMRGVIASGRFRATTDLDTAVRDSDFTFIAVGTPFDGQRIDLTYVREAVRQTGEALRTKDGYHVLVVKSTVVPGTTDREVGPLLETASGRTIGTSIGLAMNPEFLSEGTAVEDFLRPDRIVIGASDPACAELVASVYRPFEGVPVLSTSNSTAEMIKYASNSVLATLISFSNELGNLCAALGDVDMADVSRGVSLSQYFRSDGAAAPAPITAFLKTGCGFGGSCLPKDVKALVSHGQARGQSMSLLSAVLDVNANQPGRMLELLRRHFPTFEGIEVAVLGLAFKPGTDDIRESPAEPILRRLVEGGARVRAYDPLANQPMHDRVAGLGVRFVPDLQTALDGADAALLVTSWDEFQEVPARIRHLEYPPVVIDGRRMLDRASVARYEGIGS